MVHPEQTDQARCPLSAAAGKDARRIQEVRTKGTLTIVVDRRHPWILRLVVAVFAFGSPSAGIYFAIYAFRHAANSDGAMFGLLFAAVAVGVGLLFGLLGVPQSWFGRTTIELTTSRVRISYWPKPLWRVPLPLLVQRNVPTKQTERFELRQVPIFATHTPIWAGRLHLKTHREAFQIELGDLTQKAFEALAACLNEGLDRAKTGEPYRDQAQSKS